jgi:transcriptional regulator with XRE-family HTH domain
VGDTPAAARSFGAELRRWRQQRGLTQLALAHAAEVSTRHLSWLETGRSEPSRAMLLRLAEHLAVPLRQRNAWLALAGFAPLYAERPWRHAALAPLREQLQTLLDAHRPWPALAVDRHWNLLAHNAPVARLLQAAAPALREQPVNVLRLLLHPQGLAPWVEQLPAWRAHVLARLQRQWAASGDGTLSALYAELSALGAAPEPGEEGDAAMRALAEHALALPLTLTLPKSLGGGTLRLLGTVTVFGAPHDVLLSELAIETLLPADAASAAVLRQLDSL